MNLGAPELIIILLIVPFIAVTIWGIVDAGQRGQTGWLIGIIVGWVVGLGWVLAIIYLAAIRPGLVRGDGGEGPI